MAVPVSGEVPIASLASDGTTLWGVDSDGAVRSGQALTRCDLPTNLPKLTQVAVSRDAAYGAVLWGISQSGGVHCWAAGHTRDLCGCRGSCMFAQIATAGAAPVYGESPSLATCDTAVACAASEELYLRPRCAMWQL